MATIAATKITDIVSFTADGDQYIGIREVRFRIMTPEIVPFRKEGTKYATEKHITAVDDFPVVGQLRTASLNQALILLAISGDVVIVGKENSGGSNITTTITAARFRRARLQFDVQPRRFGMLDLELVAVSADGAALPITHS